NLMDRLVFRSWQEMLHCCITSAMKPKKAKMPSWRSASQTGINFLSFRKQGCHSIKIIHMNIPTREIYRSIAEVAYVIAKADKGLSSTERIAFNTIIQEELEYDSWVAQSRFELLDEVTNPSLEEAYRDAMIDLKRYKN